MRISTSAHLFMDVYGFDYISSLKRHAAAGFRVFDFGYLDFSQSGHASGQDSYRESSPFVKADWRDWINEIGTYTRENGLEFSQSHAPIFSFFTQGKETELYIELSKRSLEANGMLNIPWCVFHTSTPPTGDRTYALEKNKAFFCEMLEYAHKYNTGICVENLFPSKALHYLKEDAKFFGHRAEDLIELVDSINDSRFGICIDTGHSMCAGYQPSDLVRACGSRVKVLHIQDSDGSYDMHRALGYGKVNWKDFMQALKTVGYAGTFNYEAHNAVREVQEPFKDIAARMMVISAQHLIDLYWND